MRKNLKTSLRTRRARNPMAAYDTLPPALRSWLSQAALPWSVSSVRKVWRKSLITHGGCEARARQHMDEIERQLLARDAASVWGEGYGGSQRN